MFRKSKLIPMNLIAKSDETINASIDKVWEALVNPEEIRKYMFGATVISDWKPGSKIIWKGEWNGHSFEDKGQILEIKPPTKLQYTHFSPLAGKPDARENYHTVTIELEEHAGKTLVSLFQDNNDTIQAKEHAEQNWKKMLNELKNLLEK